VHIEALQRRLYCQYPRTTERVDLYYDCTEFETIRDTYTLKNTGMHDTNSHFLDRALRESRKVTKTGE
jgi:hypothetical protein